MADENNFDTLEYWLHSLHAKVPDSSIILVGTHSDIKQLTVPTQVYSMFNFSKFLCFFFCNLTNDLAFCFIPFSKFLYSHRPM